MRVDVDGFSHFINIHEVGQNIEVSFFRVFYFVCLKLKRHKHDVFG